jgi:hypothetical protein
LAEPINGSIFLDDWQSQSYKKLNKYLILGFFNHHIALPPHMASLPRLSLSPLWKRLRQLFRWFFPRTVQVKHQSESSQPVFFYSENFLPPPQLIAPLLQKYAPVNIEPCFIELTDSGCTFDELPFPMDEFDNESIPSNPSSLEPRSSMTVRGIVC